MPDSPQTRDEHAWRLIILELFRAQEAYLRAMKAHESTGAIAQAWNRLQEASHRRDEFLGEGSGHAPELQPRRA